MSELNILQLVKEYIEPLKGEYFAKLVDTAIQECLEEAKKTVVKRLDSYVNYQQYNKIIREEVVSELKQEVLADIRASEEIKQVKSMIIKSITENSNAATAYQIIFEKLLDKTAEVYELKKVLEAKNFQLTDEKKQ